MSTRATQYGCLTEFLPESDSAKAYLERAQLYFTANSVPRDKQVAILLSSIGASTYSLLSDLVAPDAPSSKSLAEISTILRGHFESKRVVIAERFHFHKRDQAVGETISEFDAALRKLATHCKFGDALEEVLRDRFVCGLRHEAIQQRLLSETDLTYAKAMEIAQGMEAADRHSKSLKTSEPAIRAFMSHSTSHSPCYHCGRTNHTPASCTFKDAVCHYCKNKGHIAPACRAKQKGQQPTSETSKPTGGRASGRKYHQRRTHRVQEEDTDENSGEEYHLHRLGERASEPIAVDVFIDGKQLAMELDTGAAVSIISDETRKSLFPDLKLLPSTIILKTYTEESMEVVGQLNVRV